MTDILTSYNELVMGYNEIISDILGIIDEYVPLEVIASWTDEQRDEVTSWASKVYIAANDNPRIAVPQRPAFMPEKQVLQPNINIKQERE